jgi:hypothetical protein
MAPASSTGRGKRCTAGRNRPPHWRPRHHSGASSRGALKSRLRRLRAPATNINSRPDEWSGGANMLPRCSLPKLFGDVLTVSDCSNIKNLLACRSVRSLWGGGAQLLRESSQQPPPLTPPHKGADRTCSSADFAVIAIIYSTPLPGQLLQAAYR